MSASPAAVAAPAPAPIAQAQHAAPATPRFAEAFSAQCVLMRISAFAATKSRTSSTATAAARSATGSANGRYVGATMPKELSKTLAAAVQRARRYLDSMSVAFGDSRIVLLTDYAAVRSELNVMASDYLGHVNLATMDWQAYRDQVRELTTGLWTEDLLPSTQEQYLAAFELQVSVLPMPVNPPTVALPADLAAEVQAEIAEEIHAQYQQVIAEQMDELADALDKLLVRLEKSDSRVSASTFNSLRETAERLARFNIQQDARMAKLCEATVRILGQVDPSACNSSEEYRLMLCKHLTNIRQYV